MRERWGRGLLPAGSWVEQGLSDLVTDGTRGERKGVGRMRMWYLRAGSTPEVVVVHVQFGGGV